MPWLTVFHEQLLFGTCIIVNNVCWKHYSFSVERTECEDLVLPTQREDSVQVLGLFTRFILRRYWRFQWGLVKWNHWQLKGRGDQWCTVSPVLFTKKVWCYFQPTLTLFVSVKLDSSQKEGLLLASSCVCNAHHHKPSYVCCYVTFIRLVYVLILFPGGVANPSPTLSTTWATQFNTRSNKYQISSSKLKQLLFRSTVYGLAENLSATRFQLDLQRTWSEISDQNTLLAQPIRSLRWQRCHLLHFCCQMGDKFCLVFLKVKKNNITACLFTEYEVASKSSLVLGGDSS